MDITIERAHEWVGEVIDMENPELTAEHWRKVAEDLRRATDEWQSDRIKERDQADDLRREVNLLRASLSDAEAALESFNENTPCDITLEVDAFLEQVRAGDGGERILTFSYDEPSRLRVDQERRQAYVNGPGQITFEIGKDDTRFFNVGDPFILILRPDGCN